MRVAILGTRGIPARHGGFETFAERLALYLVGRGWKVTVHCPAVGDDVPSETVWQGVRLLHVPAGRDDALGTIIFDWRSTLIAAGEGGAVLNLGYGTALFGLLYRWRGTCNIINMDGVEWRRKKWSLPARVWLYANERLACLFANHLVADHPAIKEHLATRVSEDKITMIPYGADPVVSPDPALIEPFGLQPRHYAILIARPDPDNMILEIVTAFSRRPRGIRLVVLGRYTPDVNSYHREVQSAASDEVLFVGGIYDKQQVEALRYHARLYIHGHRVGGTNPSLVEALAAGNPVLAHDNPFNRWVAGPGAHYFKDEQECSGELDSLLDSPAELDRMRHASLERHNAAFRWEGVLAEYEALLSAWQA
uniref:Glycosyltransferase family 1 protein n=1 Tax=Geobacter metallireducens TaxID=28232 RepID=A0A831XMB6_GEOME